MDQLINVNEFLRKNFKGFSEWKEFAKLSSTKIPGVVLKDGEICLSPYNPQVEFLYHQGFFRGFAPDSEFDNLKNLERGYFGNPNGYTYLARDNRVKPSRPLMDLELKIDAKKLGKQLYRDPESFLEKFHYEWNRSFMIEGAIPREAIIDISFNETIRFIPELRYQGDLTLEQTFERIKEIRQDFRRVLS